LLSIIMTIVHFVRETVCWILSFTRVLNDGRLFHAVMEINDRMIF